VRRPSKKLQEASLLDVSGADAVDPSRSGSRVARDPGPRDQQRGRVTYEIEQVIEPATRFGHRPTVQFGLHPRYPYHRRGQDLVPDPVGEGATIQ